MTSIFKEDQYFDHETNFCIAFGIRARRYVEKTFLENRISYFIRVRRRSIITKILSGWHAEDLFIIRINSRDIERAIPLVKDHEDIEIVASAPDEDWSPKSKLQRLEKERLEKERLEQEKAAEASKENAAPHDETEEKESPEAGEDTKPDDQGSDTDGKEKESDQSGDE